MKNRLKELRARHNITQQELATNVGVSRQSINAIENGEKPQPTYWFNEAMMKMSEIKQMIKM